MPVVTIDIFLLALLAVTAVAIVRVRNLFAVALLAGIYSLLSAGLFTTMDAMDVAFTEAAVGAGISTVLILGTLVMVGTEEARPRHSNILPLLVVLITGGMLVYGTMDLPPFGAADNPAHQHVAPRYIHETPVAIGIPNVVSAVLASYRAYDTMGETTVVFTAVVGVLVLLMGRRREEGSEVAMESDSGSGARGAGGADGAGGRDGDDDGAGGGAGRPGHPEGPVSS
ncbi:MAG: DUF4040 domain-containing protein [Longimicrobiales bacterium]|nr:DUF4040 domain-containing protein [Longimicrobiales bacterium]